MNLKERLSSFTNHPYFDYLLLFLVAVFICRRFLLPGFPSGHDSLSWVFTYKSIAADSSVITMLNQYWFASFPRSIPYGNPLEFLVFGGLTILSGGNADLIAKLEIFIMYFISGSSMYYLCKTLSVKRLGRIIASLSYMISYIILVELAYEGHIAGGWGYALIPLVVALFEKALQSGRVTDSILSGLAVGLSIDVIYVPYILVEAFLLFFWLLFHFLSRRFFAVEKTTLKKLLIRTSKISLPVIGFAILASSLFWLPLLLHGFNTALIAVEDLRLYALNPINAITSMFTSDCTDVIPAPGLFISPFFVLLGLIFPILAVIGYLAKRNRVTLFFLSTAIVGILFSMGTRLDPPNTPPSSPLSIGLVWIFRNIPFTSSLLHCPYRIEVITSIAYSVLAGIAISEIFSATREERTIRYLERLMSRKQNGYLFAGIAISIILLNSAILVGYAFQSFKLPSGYNDAYAWIGSQSTVTDYRLYNYPANSWNYYGYNITPTNIIDPGTFLPMLNNERVLWGGGPTSSPTLTQYFINYLNHAIQANTTNSIGKILSPANVRYIIVDAASAQGKSFFKQQTDLQKVYQNSYYTIYQNNEPAPFLTASSSQILVFGGRETLTQLSNIDAYNSTQTPLVFADQATSLNPNNFSAMLINTPDLNDLVFMLTLNRTTINARSYGYPSIYNYWKWIPSEDLQDNGSLVISQYTLTTTGNNSVKIPFSVNQDGEYQIWMRILYAPTRGHLSLYINGVLVESDFHPTSVTQGFQWTVIATTYLQKGSHIATVENVDGQNDIDQLAVVTQSAYEAAYSQTLNLIQNSQARLIYLAAANKNPANKSVYFTTTIARSSKYKLAITGTFQKNSTLQISIDGIPGFIYKSIQASLQEIGSINLSQGRHIFTVNLTSIDTLIMYSVKPEEQGIALSKVFTVQSMIQLSYSTVNPEEYTVSINATKPFLLVLSTSYDPLWKAYVAGAEIPTTSAYTFLNSFYIEKTGSLKITIKYTGQNYYNMGLAITSITTLVALTTVFYKPIRIIRRKSSKKREVKQSPTA